MFPCHPVVGLLVLSEIRGTSPYDGGKGRGC
jgi:hypothetical protein